jgi:hypothetical protein
LLLFNFHSTITAKPNNNENVPVSNPKFKRFDDSDSEDDVTTTTSSTHTTSKPPLCLDVDLDSLPDIIYTHNTNKMKSSDSNFIHNDTNNVQKSGDSVISSVKSADDVFENNTMKSNRLVNIICSCYHQFLIFVYLYFLIVVMVLLW